MNFLQQALLFWFRPVFGAGIDPIIGASLISGGSSLLGGLFGRSAKKKSLAFQREQLQEQLRRFNKFWDLGQGSLAFADAIKVPSRNDFYTSGLEAQEQFRPMFDQGLAYAQDKMSGAELDRELADYSDVASSIYSQGEAKRLAVMQALEDQQRQMAMDSGRRFGFAGSTADNNALLRTAAGFNADANLAIANAHREAAEGRYGIKEADRLWKANNIDLGGQLAEKAALFDNFASNFAALKTLGLETQKAGLASARTQPFSFAAGQSLALQRPDSSSPMGEALAGAGKAIGQGMMDKEANELKWLEMATT